MTLFPDRFVSVAVTGGRFYSDRARVFEVLDDLDPEIVIHGQCMIDGQMSGADRWADEWAHERKRTCLPYPADWSRYGKSAGPRRNHQMLKENRPNALVTFPGGKGTHNAMSCARELAIKVIEIPC